MRKYSDVNLTLVYKLITFRDNLWFKRFRNKPIKTTLVNYFKICT